MPVVKPSGMGSIMCPREMVCTKMGDEHQIVEALEDLIGVHIEDESKGRKRRESLGEHPK